MLTVAILLVWDAARTPGYRFHTTGVSATAAAAVSAARAGPPVFVAWACVGLHFFAKLTARSGKVLRREVLALHQDQPVARVIADDGFGAVRAIGWLLHELDALGY
jgi:hypothetical protein